MKEVTFKIDMIEFATKKDLEQFATKKDLEQFATKKDLERFATKEDLAKLDDTLHLFMEKVITALDRIESTMATKEDLNKLRHDHGTRIELLEDQVRNINNKLSHVHLGV
jgi:DNA invertase Pin-like site-specific DNA recombinase